MGSARTRGGAPHEWDGQKQRWQDDGCQVRKCRHQTKNHSQDEEEGTRADGGEGEARAVLRSSAKHETVWGAATLAGTSGNEQGTAVTETVHRKTLGSPEGEAKLNERAGNSARTWRGDVSAMRGRQNNGKGPDAGSLNSLTLEAMAPKPVTSRAGTPKDKGAENKGGASGKGGRRSPRARGKRRGADQPKGRKCTEQKGDSGKSGRGRGSGVATHLTEVANHFSRRWPAFILLGVLCVTELEIYWLWESKT